MADPIDTFFETGRGIGQIKEDSFPIPPRPDPYFLEYMPPDTTSSAAERNAERSQEEAEAAALEKHNEEMRDRAVEFLKDQYEAYGELNPDAEPIELTEDDIEATRGDLAKKDQEQEDKQKPLTIAAFEAMKPALIEEIIVEVMARVASKNYVNAAVKAHADINIASTHL